MSGELGKPFLLLCPLLPLRGQMGPYSSRSSHTNHSGTGHISLCHLLQEDPDSIYSKSLSQGASSQRCIKKDLSILFFLEPFLMFALVAPITLGFSFFLFPITRLMGKKLIMWGKGCRQGTKRPGSSLANLLCHLG